MAEPTDDGRVRVAIPGFASASGRESRRLPTRRAFVKAASGRKVRLTSVQASDEIRFPGLRPVTQGMPEIKASDDGMVLPSERAVSEGRAFRELFPRESALLLGTSFQGETKKAEVLLFPLRWDGSGLVLSRRLLVRLDFVGGKRGRRPSEAREAAERWPDPAVSDAGCGHSSWRRSAGSTRVVRRRLPWSAARDADGGTAPVPAGG